MPRLLAESLGEVAFELLDSGSQTCGALLSGEQVGLQGRAADSGPGAGSVRRLGLGGVELFEQVAVPVEERPVDFGSPGDAADADLVTAGGGVVESLDDALAAPGSVGAAPFGHGCGGGRGHGGGGVHGVLRADLDGGRAGAGQAEHGDAVPRTAATGGRSGCVRRRELAEVTGDFRDQPPDPGDLILRWQGLCFCPFLHVGGSEDSFPVAQQVIEVGSGPGGRRRRCGSGRSRRSGTGRGRRGRRL